MQLNIETGELTVGEAEGVVSFMFSLYPSLREKLLGTVAELRITPVLEIRSGVAEREIPDDPEALEAFAEGGPAEPFLEAGEAFGQDGETGSVQLAPSGPATSESASHASTGSAAATTGIAGVELDGDGVPWDAEIHSGGKKKNADGKWAKKRGVGDDRIKARTAELKAIMAASGNAPAAGPAPANPGSAPSPGSVGAAPAPPPASLTPEAIAAAQAAAVADPSLGAGAPAPAFDAGQPPAVQFATFMREFGALRSTGKITPETQSAILVGLGLTELANLLHRPDLIPSALEQFRAICA